MLDWIQRRLLGRAADARGAASAFPGMRRQLASTHDRIVDAFSMALELREPELRVLDHSARVGIVADHIAAEMGVPEGDRYILHTAAQLHEVGMLTLPSELVGRPGPLTRTEVEAVRGQARVSALLARVGYHPRVARLIEDQYTDFGDLLARPALAEADLLLSGIFRVADVFASVTWPRPYQDPMRPERRAMLLRGGAGTRFEPLAVSAALAL
ncbi:MAG TPA: HD domain-containing phosphohydrolase [Longimicrobium sp.]|nr:HD domain-containing phosphohydrolase [Longimicrobium sp.]